MAKYEYHLEALHPTSREWLPLFGTQDGLSYNLGRIAERRETPGPRLGLRCVRSDGKVMDAAPERTEADLGAGVGTTTRLQNAIRHAQAADRCLARGGICSSTPAREALQELINELIEEHRQCR